MVKEYLQKEKGRFTFRELMEFGFAGIMAAMAVATFNVALEGVYSTESVLLKIFYATFPFLFLLVSLIILSLALARFGNSILKLIEKYG